VFLFCPPQADVAAGGDTVATDDRSQPTGPSSAQPAPTPAVNSSTPISLEQYLEELRVDGILDAALLSSAAPSTTNSEHPGSHACHISAHLEHPNLRPLAAWVPASSLGAAVGEQPTGPCRDTAAGSTPGGAGPPQHGCGAPGRASSPFDACTAEQHRAAWHVGLAWQPGASLEACLHHRALAAACGLGPDSGPNAPRFVLLQLVAAMCHAHARGAALWPHLSPACVLLQPGGWVQLLHVPGPPAGPAPPGVHGPTGAPPAALRPANRVPLPAAASPLPYLPASLRAGERSLAALTAAWQHRALSNLDYVMLLNLAVGRRLGDASYHPFVPWVTDYGTDPRVMLGLQPPAEAAAEGGSSGAGAAAAADVGWGGGWARPAVARGGPASAFAELGASAGSGGGGAVGGWLELARSRYRQVRLGRADVRAAAAGVDIGVDCV
jgi:hypothetical protein